MKRIPYLSIRTKFIVILSVLMAAVLALQFYFTNKAQQDVLKRLTQISSSFNVATNAYFLRQTGESESKRKTRHQTNRYRKNKKGRVKAPGPDERFPFLEEWIARKKSSGNVAKQSAGSTVKTDSRTYVFRMETVTPDSQRRVAKEYLDYLPKVPGWPAKLRAGSVRVTSRGPLSKVVLSDSVLSGFSTINIDLNSGTIGDEDYSVIVKGETAKEHLRKSSNSFSFFVPDFWAADAPRLLHLTYNAKEMTKAFENLRNRNLLITALLFGLSILFIVVLARRFTEPIHSLKSAFDAVVHKDYAVTVPARSRDEIGELTVSFNYMVKELEKNRQKEILLGRKERLAALGQLAAGVAHEIKNPLNAINLTLDHLRDRFTKPDDAQARAYMRTIQGEIRRLDNIVNNFLNFIRSENLEKSEVEVNGVIHEVLHLLQRECVENNIELDFQAGEPFRMELDPGRFKTVLMNIFVNALQAMPEGGRLTVVTDPAGRQIRIRDNGPGITPERQEHIFDLFYTTKETGTGLGLPTAYKIVKAHGAEMNINSEVGVGTEVIIQF